VGEIRLDRVTKQYPGGVTAVDDLTLNVADGEFLVLVGPSGCGKSTLLRAIAGLEEISQGRVWIGDRDVTNLIPRDRDIAMVFQNYSLYPHLNVRDNLAYGLKARRTPRAEIRRRIEDVARLLHLEELLDRKPRQLSGGQRQRVAMGRAIVREPRAFLMDEPLSNLDAKLRVSMRSSLLQLHARLGVTTIYVTHDQVEAMTLGQRVAVLSDGRLQQVDRPQVLYNQPANLFVATFIGSPAMNVVEARIEGSTLAFGSLRLPLDAERRPSVPDGTTVILGIRPEDLEDAAFVPASLPTVEAEVAVVEETGADAYVIFPIDAPVVDLGDKVAERQAEEGSLLVEERTVVTARVHPGTSARAGEALRLAADPARFFFFDRTTGANLIPEATRTAGPATIFSA
jgi:multiple sugar transport system ATP-binding protein